MSVDADCSAGSPTEPFCAHEWARETIVACAALGQRRSQQFSTRADDVFFALRDFVRFGQMQWQRRKFSLTADQIGLYRFKHLSIGIRVGLAAGKAQARNRLEPAAGTDLLDDVAEAPDRSRGGEIGAIRTVAAHSFAQIQQRGIDFVLDQCRRCGGAAPARLPAIEHHHVEPGADQLPCDQCAGDPSAHHGNVAIERPDQIPPSTLRTASYEFHQPNYLELSQNYTKNYFDRLQKVDWKKRTTF